MLYTQTDVLYRLGLKLAIATYVRSQITIASYVYADLTYSYSSLGTEIHVSRVQISATEKWIYLCLIIIMIN